MPRLTRIDDFKKLDPTLDITGTYIDVGSAMGSYVRSAYASKFKRIMSFEPHPYFFAYLWHRHFHRPRIELYNKLVSSKDGFEDYYALHHNYGKLSRVGGGLKRHTHRVMEMQTVTLDRFKVDDCTFLKIDVEGHELDVLKGATETLRRCSPLIKIELSENIPETLELLDSLGYRVIACDLSEKLYPLYGELEFYQQDGITYWSCGDFQYDRSEFTKKIRRSKTNPDLDNPNWCDFIFKKC